MISKTLPSVEIIMHRSFIHYFNIDISIMEFRYYRYPLIFSTDESSKVCGIPPINFLNESDLSDFIILTKPIFRLSDAYIWIFMKSVLSSV